MIGNNIFYMPFYMMVLNYFPLNSLYIMKDAASKLSIGIYASIKSRRIRKGVKMLKRSNCYFYSYAFYFRHLRNRKSYYSPVKIG